MWVADWGRRLGCSKEWSMRGCGKRNSSDNDPYHGSYLRGFGSTGEASSHVDQEECTIMRRSYEPIGVQHREGSTAVLILASEKRFPPQEAQTKA